MHTKHLVIRCGLIGTAAALAVLGTAVLIWKLVGPRAIITVAVGKFPEQLVYVRLTDDIINGGTMFTPAKDSAKPIAEIWIHGWGVNFYYPTYVAIGRALAEHGYRPRAPNHSATQACFQESAHPSAFREFVFDALNTDLSFRSADSAFAILTRHELGTCPVSGR